VELEYKYAEDTMPRGVLGLNAPMFKEYLRLHRQSRCQQIGSIRCSRRPTTRSVDGGDDRSQEGEELLRDAGD
jgi:ribonucleotide reductase beta subunit family protein with ferritin-like domain